MALVGAGFAFAVLLAAPHRVSADIDVDIREERLTFSSGRLEMEGTVLIPPVQGQKPALVLVHGAGIGGRDTVRLEAEEFARRGIVSFIYDKRTEGYSQFDRSYRLLADDALAAVGALAALPEVEATSVGLWGVSEGAWVAPIAASSPEASDQVAFVVLVAATGVSPASQHSWFLEGQLRDRGISGSMIDAVAYRGMRLLIGMGVFAEAFHDPITPIEETSRPILALWGQHDSIQPPADSLSIITDAVGRAGNAKVTLAVIPDAGHSLRDRSGETMSLVEGYPDLVADWIHGVSQNGSTAGRIGPDPEQDHPPRDFRPLEWWESAWLVMGVQLALIIGMAGLALRIVRRLDDDRLRTWSRLMIAAALAALVGHLVYVNLLLIGEAEVTGPVIFARTVPWIGLQVLAVTASAAAAVIALLPRRESTSGRRRLLLLAAGGLFVLWAGYWRLLFP